MKFTQIICFVFLFSTCAFSQSSNMSLQGQWDDLVEYHSGVKYNDVWGYVDGAGNEYAILGSVDSVIVIDVTNCANPTYVDAFFSGNTTVWRDMKTYQDHMYAVCECADGLKVFDMSNIASTGMSLVTTVNSEFTAAHNIFIEEATAKLYAVGANTMGGESIVVYDISTPGSPVLLGNVRLDPPGDPNYYVHDVFVRNDTAYASHGHSTVEEWAIWDYSDPTAPVYVDGIVTGNYQHSSWKSDDDLYAYYAEEVPSGLSMGVIDMSTFYDGDNTNDALSISGLFSHSLESGGQSTPHNPFVHNGKLYVSSYLDGVKVFDISNPTNPVIFAYYDTYPDNNGMAYPAGGAAYDGNWGVYPFLPSGCLLASDMEYGLHTFLVGVPAPVNWNRFEAKNINDKKVRLNFSTISEENNEFFELQRSYNGKDFEYLADIPGAGTSNELNEYHFIDENIRPGKIYYRIKQVDFDGNFDYSAVRSVSIQAENFISIGPNPIINGRVTLDILSNSASSYSLFMYDLTGKTVFEKSIKYESVDQKQSFFLQIPSTIPVGSYFIKVYDENQHLMTKQLAKL